MLVDPDSVDAHDVTIAMAKANLSLNITRTVLDRVVTRMEGRDQHEVALTAIAPRMQWRLTALTSFVLLGGGT